MSLVEHNPNEGNKKTEYSNQPRCPIEFFDPEDRANCTVPGKPFAKQRPRASRRGRFTTVYTPKETVNYENLVKYSYYEENGDQKLDGPLKVEIEATFPIPQSVSKKKYQDMITGKEPHIKKPDCDNIAKICLDALNHIAFNDDSQITELVVRKQYGVFPCVRIAIAKQQ